MLFAVIAVPEGHRATRAWAALPRATREEAVKLADEGLAHGDPVVAAVVAGVVRNAEVPRVATLFLFPAVVWLAEIMAVGYAGGIIRDVSFEVMLLFLIGSAWAAIALAVTLWLRRGLPYRVLVPSLRAVLQAGPDVQPEPLTVTVRHWLRTPVLVAVMFAVPLAGWILLVERVEQHVLRSVPTLALALALYVASVVGPRIVDALRRRRASQRRPLKRFRGRRYPLGLRPEGVVFGRNPLVAWGDVDSIQLEDGGQGFIRIRWRLHDGRELVYTDSVSTRPEKIVAVARAYMERSRTPHS